MVFKQRKDNDMKQLGNLAIICAKRDDLCLSIYNGKVTVHMGCGPDKKQVTMDCCDDNAISKFIYELNHGEYRREGTSTDAAVVQTVYVCYEVNCPDLAREANAINDLTLFFTKESRDAWIIAHLEQVDKDNFIIDEEIGGPEKLAEMIAQNDSIDITLFRGEQENWNEHYDIIAKKMDIQI